MHFFRTGWLLGCHCAFVASTAVSYLDHRVFRSSGFVFLHLLALHCCGLVHQSMWVQTVRGGGGDFPKLKLLHFTPTHKYNTYIYNIIY